MILTVILKCDNCVAMGEHSDEMELGDTDEDSVYFHGFMKGIMEEAKQMMCPHCGEKLIIVVNNYAEF